MFKLTIVTPEKTIIKDAELAEITLPAHSGELNILPGHSELMTVLTAGKLSFKLMDGSLFDYAIAWGYCQITPEGVTVLAEKAFDKDQINIGQISKEYKQLEDKINQETLEDKAYFDLIKQMHEIRAQLELKS